MPAPQRYAFGDFVLERSQHRVRHRDGTLLNLTPRLFSALLLLVENPGELLTKDALMLALWPGLVVEENNLGQVVSNLRRALGDDTQGSRYIQTVPRQGFRFVATVVVLPDQDPQAALPSVATPAVTPAEAALATLTPPDSGDDHAASGVPQAPAAVADEPPRVPPGPSAPRRLWPRATLATGSAMGLGGAAWWAWTHAPAGGPSARPAPLAVLPFKPLTADGRDELLELGMSEALIARLSTVPGLVVRSVGAGLRFGGTEQDPMRAAHDLDVQWIVDGSLQRRDDQLRVTARLLWAADGSAAWSGSFDEKFTSVFHLQDIISNRVLEALAPKLQTRPLVPGGAGAPLTGIGGTRNTDDYQLYLAAFSHAQGLRADGLNKSLELFNQAIALDPGYALAYVGLAEAHRRRLYATDALPADVFEPADAAIRRALDLAPGLAEAHAGNGFKLYWYDFNWAVAEREFRRALGSNSNVVFAQLGLAMLMLTQDRMDQGFVHLRLARELDPLSPLLNALEASYLLDAGRIDEAQARLKRAFDVAPNFWVAYLVQAQLHLTQKRPDEGIGALRRAVAQAEVSTGPVSLLGMQLARLGQRDEARAILNQLAAREKTRYVPPTSLAAVQAALGEVSPALDSLDRAYAVRDQRLIFLKDDPRWAGLRPEPRFKALMVKLKLDRFAPGLSPP
jgi:DNA-binding winged helix-turn-helix (wHTH) protein/TolB-like protein/tetratricopeptide (TPR) repeat protein